MRIVGNCKEKIVLNDKCGIFKILGGGCGGGILCLTGEKRRELWRTGGINTGNLDKEESIKRCREHG